MLQEWTQPYILIYKVSRPPIWPMKVCQAAYIAYIVLPEAAVTYITYRCLQSMP